MPGTNILHKYSSYNTTFTLSVLSKEQLNSPGSWKVGTPIKNIIARSSGLGNIPTSQDTREDIITQDTGDDPITNIILTVDPTKGETLAQGSSLDLFIDNVEIDSAWGHNERGKNTNATGISFFVKEMYSVDFIQRLATAAWSQGYNNYLIAPFMLTIQWKGFRRDPNNPNEVIEISTPEAKKLERRIPIKFTDIGAEVNQSGAEYQCTCAPYPETALLNKYAFKIPDGNLNGNTVSEMLSEMEKLLNEYSVKQLEILKKNSQNTTVTAKPSKYTILVKDLTDGTDYTPILNSPIDLGPRSAQASTPSVTNNTSASKQTDQNQKNRFRISGSDSVHRVLTDILLNSEFCRAPFNSTVKNFWDENGEFTWFRIKTYTKILDNDDLTGDFQYEHIFVVHPWKVHLSSTFQKLPNINLSSLYRNIKEKIARTYNYIYTGLNQDILGFNITLNKLFTSNVNPKKGFSAEVSALLENNFQLATSSGELKTPMNQRGQYLPSSLSFQDVGEQSMTTTPTSMLTQKAFDFYTYLVNPTADLVGIELEIIGDPFYIEESWNYIDDYSALSQSGINVSDLRSGNNLVAYKDGGDVYLDLQFRYPDDRFSQNKGLPQNKKILFSGIYKIWKIQSIFQRGRFTQRLSCAKLRGDVFNNEVVAQPQDIPIGANELVGGRTPQFGQLNTTYSTLVQDLGQYYKDVFANSEVGNKLSEVIKEYGPYANDVQQIVNDPKTALLNIAEREATDKAQTVLDDYLESTGAKEGGVNIKISEIKKII